MHTQSLLDSAYPPADEASGYPINDGHQQYRNQRLHPASTATYPDSAPHPPPHSYDYGNSMQQQQQYGFLRSRSPNTGFENPEHYHQPHENHHSSLRSQRYAAEPELTDDEFLVEMRARGYSYKAIIAARGWTIAEPTLRGRHRTLTTPKEHRPRKPVWRSRDVSNFPLPSNPTITYQHAY
jgi:hypothetical protein